MRLGMNPRVIGGVYRTRLNTASGQRASSDGYHVVRVRAVCVERELVVAVVDDGHRGADGAPGTLYGRAVIMATEAIRLPAPHESRICSEADVKHGCGGGRRCLPAWFRCRLPRPWSERRYRCMELPRTSKTTLTRSAMGDWAGRGHGFAADRLRGFRALVHLQ